MPAAVTGAAVRSYRTFSPLPAPPFRARRNKRNRRFVFCGTIPGVAPAGRYPVSCFYEARTFLTPPPYGEKARLRGSLTRRL